MPLRRRFALATCVGLAASMAGLPHAQSATIVPLPEPNLTHRADAVALGEVIETQTMRTSQGIVTWATFRVFNPVHGTEAGRTLKFSLPGGRMGNIATHVDGAPALRKGQWWVAFLEAHPNGGYRPLGLGYGLLPVTRQPDGKLQVKHNLSGLSALHNLKPFAQLHEGMPVQAYLARLRSYGPFGASKAPPQPPRHQTPQTVPGGVAQ